MKAHAKINLNLYIRGKLPNGYHELESLCVFASDLYDEIEFFVGDNGQGGHIEDNIVDKAIFLMKSKFNIKAKTTYNLKKNIPVGAGLGGGSADAAVALNWFNKQYNLNLSKKELCEIGLELGADVPACVYSKPLIFSGIGEQIKLLDEFIKCYILLVNPNVHVSTVDVFKKVRLSELEGENHLTKFACEVEPEIENLLNLLSKNKRYGMSGSGATCFAIFDNQLDALKIQKSLPKNYWSCVTGVIA